MASITVGFTIPAEEKRRLDHLVETFAHGNRGAFLRLAMKHMEVLERADRLRDLQAYGVQHRTAEGRDEIAIDSIVHQVLAKKWQA